MQSQRLMLCATHEISCRPDVVASDRRDAGQDVVSVARGGHVNLPPRRTVVVQNEGAVPSSAALLVPNRPDIIGAYGRHTEQRIAEAPGVRAGDDAPRDTIPPLDESLTEGAFPVVAYRPSLIGRGGIHIRERVRTRADVRTLHQVPSGAVPALDERLESSGSLCSTSSGVAHCPDIGPAQGIRPQQRVLVVARVRSGKLGPAVAIPVLRYRCDVRGTLGR